jgi:hypothetical protein
VASTTFIIDYLMENSFRGVEFVPRKLSECRIDSIQSKYRMDSFHSKFDLVFGLMQPLAASLNNRITLPKSMTYHYYYWQSFLIKIQQILF